MGKSIAALEKTRAQLETQLDDVSKELMWKRLNSLHIKERIIARSAGEVGTGKTTFWLGAPGPIVIQSLDQGLEGVAEEYAAKKAIYVSEYEWAPTDELEQDAAIEIRDRFIRDFEYAIQHARTVVWDRETDVWELFRYAEFGRPTDAPKNYAALYQRYRRLINMTKATDVNFGLIQSMTSVWKATKKADGGTQLSKTTERVPKGCDEVDGLVHLTLTHKRDNGQFVIEVGKSRGPGGRTIQDQTLPGMSFGEFAQLVFPDSDEETWQ